MFFKILLSIGVIIAGLNVDSIIHAVTHGVGVTILKKNKKKVYANTNSGTIIVPSIELPNYETHVSLILESKIDLESGFVHYSSLDLYNMLYLRSTKDRALIEYLYPEDLNLEKVYVCVENEFEQEVFVKCFSKGEMIDYRGAINQYLQLMEENE